MARYKLMPPNFQDLTFWKEFCDAIDYVWKNEIDNPQKAFKLLRDTYAMTYVPYGELPDSSYPNNEYDPLEGTKIFDINNFFDFSRKAEEAEFTILADTNVVDLTTYSANNVQTGYPQTLVILYRWNGVKWTQVPPSQYKATSPTELTFSYTLLGGTQLKVVERISSPELSSQLRYLGFQFPNTEFISRASSIIGSPALQVLASNYGNYLAATKGTPQFFDFFGFCLASEFTVRRLWSEVTKPNATVGYQSQTAPYKYDTSLTFNEVVAPPTIPQNSITLVTNIDIDIYPYPKSNVDVYTKAPLATTYTLRPLSDYDPTPGVPSSSNILTFTAPLAIGTEVLVLYKTSKIPYGVFREEGDPLIGTPVWLGGDWFPTSHVNLRYNLSKYGGSLDSNEIRQFFDYVSNLNLVLDSVILSDSGTIAPVNVGLAAKMKITQL